LRELCVHVQIGSYGKHNVVPYPLIPEKFCFKFCLKPASSAFVCRLRRDLNALSVDLHSGVPEFISPFSGRDKRHVNDSNILSKISFVKVHFLLPTGRLMPSECMRWYRVLSE